MSVKPDFWSAFPIFIHSKYNDDYDTNPNNEEFMSFEDVNWNFDNMRPHRYNQPSHPMKYDYNVD